jgi:branched-chain amino acid transport system substrate-binding protein
MRKLLAMIVAGSFLILSGCKNNQKITIGGLFPLSGNSATFGQSSKQGMQLAIDHVNSQGGIIINKKQALVYPIYEDDEGQPEKAANACRKLISQNVVCAIIGAVMSKNSLAIAPICQASKVPMISSASTNEKVTEVGDYIFRACFIDPFQGMVMADYAFHVLKAEKAALIFDNGNDYNKGLAEVFKKKFIELGGKIVASEAFTDESNTVDFKAQLTTIKNASPDFIYSPNYYASDALIMKQAHEIGLNVATGGADGWDSPKLVEIGGPDVEGCVFSNHFSKEDTSTIVREFVYKYRTAFGADPDALASLAYDAATIALSALKTAGSTNGESLKNAIRNSKVQGVCGTVEFDNKRNPIKSAVILRIENGQQEFVMHAKP